MLCLVIWVLCNGNPKANSYWKSACIQIFPILETKKLFVVLFNVTLMIKVLQELMKMLSPVLSKKTKR